MTNKVTLVENILEPATWQTFTTDDICDFLYKHFNGTWPSTAHIYLDRVEKRSDITPFDNAGMARLSRTSGHLYVVVYPGITLPILLLIVAVVSAAVAIGISFLLRPSAAKPQLQQDSANNQLANRTNEARPNQRIPDIFGQLWATFDLLAVPYTTFISNDEYEHCYMCVGRGDYEFETVGGLISIRDDQTPLEQIDGAQAKVFAPFTNPTLGSSPSLVVGAGTFTDPVVNLQVFTGVNGQILQAPNVSSFNQIDYPGPVLRFRSPNIIEVNTGSDLTTAFQANDLLYIGGQVANDDIAHDPGGVHAALHLAGVYEVSSVTFTQVLLSSPATINPAWSSLAAFTGSVSNYESDSIMGNSPLWIGGNSALGVAPFWLNYPSMTEVWCNFLAAQGSFKIDNDGTVGPKGQHYEVDSTIEVGITPCDALGVASGSESFHTVTIFGSHTDEQAKGSTLKITVAPGLGGVLIRAHRTSQAEIRGGWSNSDEVQWRDCYIITAMAAVDFGNITTIQTLIKNTKQALVIKDRKMNALVTRKVPSPSGFAPAASTNAADILCAMAFDPYIGNLQTSQVDVTGIYDVAGAGGSVQEYFACFPDLTTPTQFCYTFDDSKVSFEEAVTDLATSIFCVAYRRGGLLSLTLEQQTPNSTLLFNHRNKIPKSETRTVTFGTVTANDGIDLDYIEPAAPNYPNIDTTVTISIPPTLTATNPKKVKTIGIRNVQQATLLAWRLYWKLVAQNTITQFDCTEEAALLVLQDRILVADNTRSDTQDGEVLTQSVLILTLSQDVVFDARFNYSIFLQHPDETVENIGITAGANPNQVVLAHAPTIACITDQTNYAKTGYMIVNDAPARQSAFLVAEKTSKGNRQWEVKAINYDDLYYQHDGDYAVNMTVGGMFIEVFEPSTPPDMSVAGLFLEVMTH